MFLKHLEMGLNVTRAPGTPRTQPQRGTHPSALHRAGMDLSIPFHPQPCDGSAAVSTCTVPYAAPSARCLLHPGWPVFPCTSGISLTVRWLGATAVRKQLLSY